MEKEKDTFKYIVRRNGKIVLRSRTRDFNRRVREIKARYPDATVKKVGDKVTWEEAGAWIGEK